MADRKLSQLPETTSFAEDDIIPLVDVSETTTKKIQISNLLVDQITPDERTKLAGVADGATANQTDAHLLNRDNHVGTIPASVISDFNTVVDARIGASDGAGHGSGSVTQHDDISSAGSGSIITSAERTKLTGIATGATANDSDTNLKNRANHTGTQLLATISDAGSSASLNVPATGNASITEVVKGDDSRLTDARTPRLAS